MLRLADDVLLLKDFDSVTGADTVRTFDSENLRGPKMLALSLTLTLSSAEGIILLSGAGGEGEGGDLPVIDSLELFSCDLWKAESANSSGLDMSDVTHGFCTEAITWDL